MLLDKENRIFRFTSGRSGFKQPSVKATAMHILVQKNIHIAQLQHLLLNKAKHTSIQAVQSLTVRSHAEKELATRHSCTKKFQRILELSLSQHQSQSTLHTNNNVEAILFPSFSKIYFTFNPVQFQSVTLCKINPETQLSRNFIHRKAEFQACARHEGPTVSHSSALTPESSETANTLPPFPEACDSLLLPPVAKQLNPGGGH